MNIPTSVLEVPNRITAGRDRQPGRGAPRRSDVQCNGSTMCIQEHKKPLAKTTISKVPLETHRTEWIRICQCLNRVAFRFRGP